MNNRPLWYLAALIVVFVLSSVTFNLASGERHEIVSPFPTSKSETPAPNLENNAATQQPSQDRSLSNALPVTATLSLAPEITPTITVTPTITLTPVPTATEATISPIYAPIIIRKLDPTPPPEINHSLFCSQLSSPKSIPDNYSPGIVDAIPVNVDGFLADIDVSLEIDHTWVGDLVVDLAHIDTGKTIRLIDRPGHPSNNQGCPYDDIYTILDDDITSSVEYECSISPAAISGIYIPQNPLSAFFGENMSGQWELRVADYANNDVGKLINWCVAIDASPVPVPPPNTPPPLSFPSSAQITGLTGKDQALPLDCESRSAVDWARYFGYNIGELAFFNQLPHSDNPDKGFVGNVYGIWGQIPPNSYGVHAEPVAALLRDYGVSAYAHRPLSWDQLRYEISQGRPVFVWIIGSVINGIPVYYTPTDGHSTIVARYEHTVIVTGYTQSSVTFLNGDTLYTTSLRQFLDSWSALGNMAITNQP
jgi:subtilisin-like proprotein convertase family protein/uncharacterized protein YvpB